MSVNIELLEEVRERETSSPFNYGIMPADRYVKTISDCVGSEACYKFATKDAISFQDVLTKAANTLVYSTEDAVTIEKAASKFKDIVPGSIELPKNTLIVVKHVLTTRYWIVTGKQSISRFG